MEIREGGKAEENVDNVVGEIEAFFPVLSKNPSQSTEQALVLSQLVEEVRVSSQLEDECRALGLALHVFVEKLLLRKKVGC